MAENRELALVLKLVADQFQSELKKSGGLLGDFQKAISDWRVQLTAVGGALFAVAKSTANYGEEALKTSQRIGLTVEATTALQHAANMADVPMATLENGLKKLAQNAVEAAQGTGEGAQLFNALGVSARDASGQIKPLDALFFEFQDRLNGVGNQAEFVDAGVKAFGKSFLDMVPLIKQGSAATREAMGEAKMFGLVMSKEQAEAANRFNDELKRLTAQLNGMKLAVGNELIPVMRELIELFRNIGVGTGLSTGIEFLFDRFTGLNLLLKEMQANSRFLFGKGKDELTWQGLGEEIDRIEAETAQKRLLFRHPGALNFMPTAGPPAGGTGGAGLGPDLKKLQDDYRLYITGLTAMGQERLDKEKAAYALYIQGVTAMGNEYLAKQRENYQLYIQGLTSAGQEYINSIKGTGDDAVKLFRDKQKEIEKERKIVQDNAQAWVQYFEQVGGSTEGLYTARMNLIRANLAQELQLNQEQAGQLLMAWQNHDSARAQALLTNTTRTAQEVEAIELRTMQASLQAKRAVGGDFLEGWALGLQRYIRDTESAFGLAADMARRTAQTMEQSFRTFFFDAFEGRIQSLKDVFENFGRAVKQMVAQIIAQLMTMMLFKLGATILSGPQVGWMNDFFKGGGFGAAGTSIIPGGFNKGGFVEPQRFAFGGVVRPTPSWTNDDSVFAMLTPGEGVLSRRGMAALDKLNAGNTPAAAAPNVTINFQNFPASERPQINVRRQFEGMVIDVIRRNRADLFGYSY